jgi:hypothetical protein
MNKQSAKRAILTFLLVLAAFFAISAHALAQVVPFYWNYINVDMDVQTNGDILVTESQQYNFTADYQNQRYRYLPLDKGDKISDVTVQENGKIIPSETETKANWFSIKWQHQLKAPEVHTFILKYRVVAGLQVKGQTSQVDWKAIFADRQAPVKKADVRVHLPKLLAGKVTSFQSFGVTATDRQIDPQTFEFVASQPIEPQQELKVQVTFPAEILNLPQSRSPEIASNGSQSDVWMWGFVLILGGFLVYAIFLVSGGGGGGGSGGNNSYRDQYGIGGGDGGGGGGSGGSGG